jgi:hypothetical protein
MDVPDVGINGPMKNISLFMFVFEIAIHGYAFLLREARRVGFLIFESESVFAFLIVTAMSFS